MKKIETDIPGVFILEPKMCGDERGFFMETYQKKNFSELGIKTEFVQDNHSKSTQGVLRGLHYQLRNSQAKLVRVLHGEVYDVAVDIRRGSPTFGKWTSVVLSGENKRQFFVPQGFAHGFYVLSETAEFEYKCSDYYEPSEERGILWSDAGLNIDWPLLDSNPTLSEKDRKYTSLSSLPEDDLPVF
jgi:dTDP-4-dehydrorhamnose 3,5-epimerase